MCNLQAINIDEHSSQVDNCDLDHNLGVIMNTLTQEILNTSTAKHIQQRKSSVLRDCIEMLGLWAIAATTTLCFSLIWIN